MDDTAKVIASLRKKFPAICGPRTDDICYATQNRQDAVKQLALECDLVLVVGSPNSSNSNRLRDKTNIGVTAGASAPEVLVQAVIKTLEGLGAATPEELPGEPETIHFSLPKALRV